MAISQLEVYTVDPRFFRNHVILKWTSTFSSSRFGGPLDQDRRKKLTLEHNIKNDIETKFGEHKRFLMQIFVEKRKLYANIEILLVYGIFATKKIKIFCLKIV